MALFKPYKIFNRITDIPIEWLVSNGVKGVALDADNTLSTHHSQTPLDSVPEWLAKARESGIKLIMVSNANEKRVAPFANKLGLEFTSLSCKPLPFGFIKAARKMGLRRGEIAAIGDQIFTDVMGANLAGLKPILLIPIEAEQGASFKLRRRLEKPLINKFSKKGLVYGSDINVC